MTPELKRALELTERQQLQQLRAALDQIETASRNEYAKKGQLRGGGFVGALLSRQVPAMEDAGKALATEFVRLAAKAGRISPEDGVWMKTRLERLVANEGFLASFRERARQTGLPAEPLMEGVTHKLAAARNHVLLHFDRAVAEEDIVSVFDILMNDRVTIRATDGTVYEDVAASVQGNKILTERTDIPVKPGMLIVRRTPAGIEEGFEVLDPGFSAGLAGIPGHYSMTVRRTDAPPRKTGSRTVIYNLQGQNNRFNINSTDASINVVTEAPDEIFKALRETIEAKVESAAERDALVGRVRALEAETPGGDGFARKYAELMALAANHMEVVAPFIPALGQLLIGG